MWGRRSYYARQKRICAESLHSTDEALAQRDAKSAKKQIAAAKSACTDSRSLKAITKAERQLKKVEKKIARCSQFSELIPFASVAVIYQNLDLRKARGCKYNLNLVEVVDSAGRWHEVRALGGRGSASIAFVHSRRKYADRQVINGLRVEFIGLREMTLTTGGSRTLPAFRVIK